jgi:thiol-disulfide isomerase/thioredoxin
MTLLRKGAMALPLVLSITGLLACAPKPVAPVAPAAPAAPSTAVTDPAPGAATDTSPGSVGQMLLKAGFQVPKSEFAAEDFTLQGLDGKNVSLSSLKGKLVFLSFWATWCGPCKQELPSVQAMYDRLKSKGFEILAVDVMEDKKAVTDFVKTNKMTFPVLLDSTGSVGRTYDAGSIPTNYIVDRNGKILARVVGYDGTAWTDPSRIAIFEKLLTP